MNTKDYTILIVDDEVDLREILSYQFKKKGYNVLEAANGVDAFELVNTNRVDLIISDIQMPGGNGADLLMKVREKSKLLPVVLFITGFSDFSVEEAYKRGAAAVFAKPFNQNELFEAVNRALSGTPVP